MAEVVRERDGFGQVLVEMEVAGDRAADLRDFEAVREPRAEKVAFVIDEDLRLVFEASEGRGMDDAVAVALVLGAAVRRRLGMAPAALALGRGGVGRKRVRHAPTGRSRIVRQRLLRRFADERPAYFLQENESQAPAHRLFCRGPSTRGSARGQGPALRPDSRARTSSSIMRATSSAAQIAQALRQPGGENHSGRDRFTVQPRAVTGARLDRVAEGMAEVEQRTHVVAFALVERDHLRFVAAGLLDRVGESVRIAAPADRRC